MYKKANLLLPVIVIAGGLLALVGEASGAVLGITDADFSPDNDPVTTDASLTSYTNSAGTFTSFTGATSVTNASTGASGSIDSFRNYWTSGIADGTGAASDASSLVGLGIGLGAIDLTTADLQFGGLVGDGINTNGNDIFLFEVGSLDAGTTILPLNAGGTPIGNFSLSLGNFTDTLRNINLRLQNSSGATIGVSNAAAINGIGFDLSDFTGGTGTLTGVTGIRVSNSVDPDGLDLGIAGATIIPEPGTAVMLLGGAGMLGLVRRRKH